MYAEFVDVAETAQLVRAALRREFPKTKFSVRSSRYAGGSDVDVRYIDGPPQPLVEAVVGPYRGGGFDGSIDLAYSRSAWLFPDGHAERAGTEGTAGSMGSVPSAPVGRQPAGARLVQFGADHLFVTRRLTPAGAERLADALSQWLGAPCHVRPQCRADSVPPDCVELVGTDPNAPLDSRFHHARQEVLNGLDLT